MSLDVNIVKKYDDFTLRMQFSAEQGILGILGASGSGKSMTLKCIAGIETPDEGTIVLDGEVLFDSDKKINLPPQKRRIGYLFQNAALFPNMTAEQNLLSVARRKDDRDGNRVKARSLLKLMELDKLGARYPSELSGGQQQRVALARILMSEPRVIMLDEPFSALDSYLRWLLEKELATILGQFDGLSIFVSHNRDEVYRLCDTLAIVSDGGIAGFGDKWDIFNDPRHYDACLLTGCKNILPVIPADGGGVVAPDWGLSFGTNGHDASGVAYVGIRAHDIVLTDDPSAPNCFEYETVSTLRDTFSYILMLRKKGVSDAKTLRLEMSRELYESLSPLPRYAYIPQSKLLFLNQ